MGNVSVDMDSVVGCLTLAYYYSLKYKEPFIPVVNCSRSFFPMKLDINQHLEEHKVPELIFWEDDIKNYPIEDVSLIDHNKLDNSQEALLTSKVRRIIDHHIDNNLYTD